VTGSSSYEKRIYLAAVSQRLRNTGLKHCVSLMLCVQITDEAAGRIKKFAGPRVGHALSRVIFLCDV